MVARVSVFAPRREKIDPWKSHIFKSPRSEATRLLQPSTHKLALSTANCPSLIRPTVNQPPVRLVMRNELRMRQRLKRRQVPKRTISVLFDAVDHFFYMPLRRFTSKRVGLRSARIDMVCYSNLLHFVKNLATR